MGHRHQKSREIRKQRKPRYPRAISEYILLGFERTINTKQRWIDFFLFLFFPFSFRERANTRPRMYKTPGIDNCRAKRLTFFLLSVKRSLQCRPARHRQILAVPQQIVVTSLRSTRENTFSPVRIFHASLPLPPPDTRDIRWPSDETFSDNWRIKTKKKESSSFQSVRRVEWEESRL